MVGSGEVEEVNSSRVRYWDDVMLVDLERAERERRSS